MTVRFPKRIHSKCNSSSTGSRRLIPIFLVAFSVLFLSRNLVPLGLLGGEDHSSAEDAFQLQLQFELQEPSPSTSTGTSTSTTATATATIANFSSPPSTKDTKDVVTTKFQTSFLLIPETPDPQVAHHLSFAWTGRTTGSDLEEQQQVTDDPHLSRIRNRTCPPTSQWRLIRNTTTTTTTTTTTNNNNVEEEEEEPWILASLDSWGNDKSMGGDEFYVSYQHRPTTSNFNSNSSSSSSSSSSTALRNSRNSTIKSVAYSYDQGDGTYRLDFRSTPFHPKLPDDPANGGWLTIYFQYTCRLGTIPAPEKENWRTGGAVMTRYGPIPVDKAPPTKAFQRPNQDGTIDLGRYKKVVMFGDSNMHGLYTANEQRMPNLKFIRKPDSPVNLKSMPRLFLPKIAWFLNLTMHEPHEQDEQDDDHDPSAKYALMIGSFCWDVVFQDRLSGPNFENHLQAVKTMLESLKEQFANKNVDIYWHSGFALHLHVASGLGWERRNPLKYMSYSRGERLYSQQKQLLDDIGGVTTLQFMEATYLSADRYAPQDARHVQKSLSKMLLEWYYPNLQLET